MTKSLMPWEEYVFMMCHKMGLPPISIMGLGLVWVSSEMRVPNPETDLSKEQMLLWHRILHKKGWIAPLWPKEYGGPGWSITRRFIFEQETTRAGRQARIVSIVSSTSVHSQSELVALLADEGIEVTQATLSRDLEELGAVKLRGADGEVYALAQGALTATGIDASAAGSKVAVGVPTSARVPSGATVEKTVDNPFATAEQLILNVREGDFTTTTAIINAINGRFGPDVANALDGVSISIRAPQDLSQRVAFMSMIENMDVLPGDPPARVVINSRTGTVVISRNVRVTAAAVSHGTISVAIAATNEVSQPNALAAGTTTPVQNADIAVSEPNKPMFLFQPGIDLRQIVDAVNQVGASPSALIAILEALKSSGSLRAELVVI